MTDDRRRPSSQRGYDATWRRVRRAKLSVNPLCEKCLSRGRVTPATMVHHKKPVCDYPDLRLVWENLESLCEACHDVEHSGPGKQLKGANSEGFPTHPDHPWNQMK